jgi:hypothetical protein
MEGFCSAHFGVKLHCQLSLEESDLGIPQKGRNKKINPKI